MIAWEDWGEAAFARARAEGRPVLLTIGATWCHWCHVMDAGTWAHPAVARLVAERFVPVRVDTDHRPDVNERYNQGGWPSVAVLDAEGEVLLGRTWVPAQELLMLLRSVSEPGQRWSIAPSLPEPAPEPSPGLPALRERLRRAYDPYHGGFGDLQKFPHPALCEWLLDRRLRGEDDGGMLVRTLDAMAGGGLRDATAGGFFRYATRDDWQEPHYEKLLDDNARLIRLYARAAAATGSAPWRACAEEAVRWAIASLWQDDAGAFGGSQDADEDWYTAPVPDRGAPPTVDGAAYAGWNGVMVGTLVRAAATWGRPGLAGLARIVGEGLLARAPDGVVPRVPGGVAGLLADQAEVADGWLHLWQHTGDLRWRDAATRALVWARDHLAAPGGGGFDAPAGGPGLLRHRRRPLLANIAFAEACGRLGALTGDAGWLAVARSAADAALDEGEAFGFVAASAAGVRERLDAPFVVVKVAGAPALRDAFLADPHPGVLALAVSPEEAARIGLRDGSAMACSASACARPSPVLADVRRAVAQLLGDTRA